MTTTACRGTRIGEMSSPSISSSLDRIVRRAKGQPIHSQLNHMPPLKVSCDACRDVREAIAERSSGAPVDRETAHTDPAVADDDDRSFLEIGSELVEIRDEKLGLSDRSAGDLAPEQDDTGQP